MAEMVQNVLGFMDEHINLLYIIIPAVIAVILMLIPSKKTYRWGIGIFAMLILLCIVYLVMMVVGAGNDEHILEKDDVKRDVVLHLLISITYSKGL